MITKSKKEALLKRIKDWQPHVAVPSSLQSSQLGYDLQRSIQQAIKDHVDHCLTLILEDLYTHEDFESDMKL